MKHSIDDHMLHMPNCECAIREKIIHVVNAHRRAMELVHCVSFFSFVSVKSIIYLKH